MTIEIYVREKAVDMSKHFVIMKKRELPAIISKTVGMQIVSDRNSSRKFSKVYAAE